MLQNEHVRVFARPTEALLSEGRFFYVSVMRLLARAGVSYVNRRNEALSWGCII